MDKVKKEAKIHSYVSGAGEVCQVEIGSENYIIVTFSKGCIDISLKNLLVTVYDNEKDWNTRQMKNGRLVKKKE